MIRIEALFKDFPGKKDVLKELNLSVKNNEIVTITGINGCGKTTLLKLVSGIIIPSSGNITIANGSKQKNLIGYLNPNNEGFFGRLNGQENLKLFGTLSKIKMKQINQTIDKWRELPAFKEALKTPFAACSSGMKSSLLLCKSILHSPRLLLLDEPFTNLDQVSRAFVADKLRSFSKEGTILLTSHLEEEYTQFSTRKVQLMEGRIV